MSIVFNTAYLLLLLIASPFLVYNALRKGKYRQGLTAKLLGAGPRRSGVRKCVWLHAVSVGEVNLLRPVLKTMEQRRSDIDFVISTTTKTGYELAVNTFAPRPVVYCPLDFSWAVKRAVSRIRPDLLVLVELELWPQLIQQVRRHGGKVAVINGRLSDSSFRGYRWIQPIMAGALGSLDLVAVQNATYAERFVRLGARESTVHVCGSLKFDGAQTNRRTDTTERLTKLAGISEDDLVLLAGSTQRPEEELALSIYRRLSPDHPNLRLILAPRHPHRFQDVAQMLDRSGLRWRRRSELSDHISADRSQQPRILLVDTIGELAEWWGTAHIAYVGGSMGRRGGQNMIEPAAYGAAVCFGPHTHNFRDIVSQMIEHNAAQMVSCGEELTAFVQRCLEQPEFAKQQGANARRLVIENLGAAERTCDLLESLLTGTGSRNRRAA